MELVLLISSIGILMILVVQDFKSRAISWFIIPLLFVVYTVKAILTIEVTELLIYFGINILMVFTNLLGVGVMVSLKEKKITNILNTYLGLGDILFFIVIAVVFSPLNFFIFFMGSVLVSSIVYGLMMLTNKKQQLPFPLAGAMSLLLVIASLLEYFNSSIQFYQDLIFLI